MRTTGCMPVGGQKPQEMKPGACTGHDDPRLRGDGPIRTRAEQANRPLQQSGPVDTSCRACHRCTGEWRRDGNGVKYQQYGASGYPFSNPTGADVTGGMNGILCEMPGSGTCRERVILSRKAGRVSFQQGERSPTDLHSVEKRRDRDRVGRIGISSERCALLSS